MSTQTRCLALLLALVAAGPAGAATCSVANPEVGTLSLDTGTAVKGYRGSEGETVNLGSGALLCLGDRLLASAASGRVMLTSGETRPFAAGAVPDVPSSRATILDWVTGNPKRWLSRPAQLGGRVLGGGGDGEIMLAGLLDGKARLSLAFKELNLPIDATAGDRTFQLFAPGARLPAATAIAKAGETIITFRHLHLRPGLWKILDVAMNRFRGFTVAETWPARDSFSGQLGPLSRADSLLMEACVDPVTNSLDAYEGLLAIASTGRQREILLAWQYPTEQLSCATPAN